MMGVQEAPARLFYDFDMEAHVPSDHMLREIDRFLDVDTIRQQLKQYYSHLGRPSIDPELIVRMLVVGYVMGIRSERRLCDEVHLNLAYRWFCRLGLNQKVPDHSTFSKYRPSRQIALQSPVRQCMANSATVICCVLCSKLPSHAVSLKASSVVMDLLLMRA